MSTVTADATASTTLTKAGAIKRVKGSTTPWLPQGRGLLLLPGFLWMLIFLIAPMFMIVRASVLYNLSPGSQPQCEAQIPDGGRTPVIISPLDENCAFSSSLAFEDWRRFFVQDVSPPSDRDVLNFGRDVVQALALEAGYEISGGEARGIAEAAVGQLSDIDFSTYDRTLFSNPEDLDLREIFALDWDSETEQDFVALRRMPPGGSMSDTVTAATAAFDEQLAAIAELAPDTDDAPARLADAGAVVLQATLSTVSSGGSSLIDRATATSFLQSMWRTLKVWLIVLTVTIVIGYPIGLFIGLFVQNKITQTALLVACVIPFWTSFLIRVIAMRPILGREGVISQFAMSLGLTDQPIEWLFANELSAVIVLSQIYVVFMAGPVAFMIARIDRALIEAARDLGANTWQVFRRVIMPLSVPGVVVGSIFVSVMVLVDYAVVRQFGAGTVSVLGLNISGQVSNNEWVMAAVCGVVLTILTTVIIGGLLRMVSLRREL